MIDREAIKNEAKKRGIRSTELLALTSQNDPFYIHESSKEKAEWFQNIWEKEGWKEKYDQWKALGKPQDNESKQKYLIHNRGLHYSILGLGYTFKQKGKIIPYENNMKSWVQLENGSKYSRYLNLVPYEAILDEKNPNPENIPKYWSHDEFEIKDVEIFDDILNLTLPKLYYDNTDDFIQKRVSRIMDDLFKSVEYYPLSEQPNYLEIWAEKKGVVPFDVAKEFNATVRPAGSGEFSVDMCFQAVRKAKREGKDLHIFMLSDFDPKGRDMPKSVARKVEYIARNLRVTAFVHFVALTKEQCIINELPSVPAKKPKSDTKGAKGYETHTKIFKEYAGQNPTELNSFMSKDLTEYKTTIRNAIRPYYDKELDSKFKEELKRLRENIKSKLQKEFDTRKNEMEKIREKLKEKYETLKSVLKPIIEKKEQELGLNQLQTKYTDLVNFNVEKVIESEKFKIPEVYVNNSNDALLDTRRDYFKQIEKYKEFDIRDNKSEDVLSK